MRRAGNWISALDEHWYRIGILLPLTRLATPRETLVSLSQLLTPLNEQSSQPLYQQLQRSLREAIQKRVLGPEDALPAERDLAEELEVSRITVRKAIDGLVQEGLLTRRHGSGTFVCARVEKNFS